MMTLEHAIEWDNFLQPILDEFGFQVKHNGACSGFDFYENDQKIIRFWFGDFEVDSLIREYDKQAKVICLYRKLQDRLQEKDPERMKILFDSIVEDLM